MHSLLEAVLAVGREFHLGQALRSIVEAAAAPADARYAALGVIGPDGKRLSAFHTVGAGEEEIARIGPYPEGHGILGELIRPPEPLRPIPAGGRRGGLRDMAERAERLGGGLDVTGPAGRGTTLVRHVPVGER